MAKTATPTLASIFPTITPTGRLILRSLSTSPTPLSIANLSEATGATPGTLEKVVRKLVKRGYLLKTANGSVSLYSLTFGTN